MSNGKTFSTHPLAHGASTTEKIAHVVDVKNDKDADGKPRFRAKCRIEGDQRDEAAIPDENLQWFRVEMPVNSFGSSPYLKPGMKVRIKDHGGSPGSTGISPYISSIVSYQPTNPEDGQSSGATLKRKKGVGPRVQQPPPREDFPQWMGQPPWPTEATKTRESRRAGRGDTYVPGQSQNAAKAPHEAPNKNRHEETGTPSKAGGALTDDDTMGSQKRQDNPDFQTQIKSLIGNQGAYVPQALDMIMQMKKVTGMQNPKAIQAVGAGNLAGAIKSLQGLFPKKKSNGKEEPKNNKCALENRPNLTPEELAECEELDKLSGLAADESEGASETALYPPVEPEYETYTANSWNDQHANTIDTPSYQAGIANVASYLMANADFIANVSTAVDSGVVANGITGNTAQSNQVANATYNPTVSFIIANTTSANTLANGIYTYVAALIAANSTTSNNLPAKVLTQKITTYTATGAATHTKIANLVYMEVVVVGGGGNGGNATANTTTSSQGGGGGAGGVVYKTLANSLVRATEQLVVGASRANSTFGNTGSSFSILAANAGSNGGVTSVTGGGNGTPGGRGIGGAATGGDINLVGGDGEEGIVIGAASWAPSGAGHGGSNPYGQGGTGDGIDGKNYGGGGSGGYTETTGNSTGGNGAQGVVIVKEYYTIVI